MRIANRNVEAGDVPGNHGARERDRKGAQHEPCSLYDILITGMY